METITQINKIPLESKYLDSDFSTALYEKINNTFRNKCTANDGYIISVDKDIAILGNEINMYGTCVFNVKYNIQTLKPQEGQELEGVIKIIVDVGIFVEIFEKMNVFIPQEKLAKKKYVYNEENGVYIRESTSKKSKTLQVDQLIKVKIEKINFENNNFASIGCLV